MFGKIKDYFKKKREKKTALLDALVKNFDSLEKLEKGGMLAFDIKNRRLFIEQPLAYVMLDTPDKWKNFLQNVFVWLYWRQCQEAWEHFIIREEVKAVNRAKRKYAVLTHRDIARIRMARRDAVTQGDVQPPKIEPFEFFVVRAKYEKPDDKEKKEVPSGEILAVGNYDYERDSLEIADWQTVKDFMQEKG